MPKRIIRLIDLGSAYYVRHLKHSPMYVIINTLAAIAFSVFFILWLDQNQQLHSQASQAKTLAANTRSLTKENERLINRIQNQRRDLLYRGCRDQNSRHDDSLTALRKLLKKSGVSQVRRDNAYKQTKILIDALVPKRNCVKLANKYIKPNPKIND